MIAKISNSPLLSWIPPVIPPSSAPALSPSQLRLILPRPYCRYADPKLTRSRSYHRHNPKLVFAPSSSRTALMHTKGRALASVDPGKLRLRAEGTAARSLATSFSSYQVCATCQPDGLSHYIVGCAVFLFLFRTLLSFLLCIHGVQFRIVVQRQWSGGTETAGGVSL